MKQQKTLWHRISRPKRAILNVVLIVLFGFWIYVAKDCPPLTPEMQFRRLEKSALIGPSHILDTIDIPFDSNYRLLLADTQDGVLLFRYHSKNYTSGELHYRKKTGNITVLACPCFSYVYDDFSTRNYVELPVMVFDNYTNAVRAELEIEVQFEDYHKTYYVESVREKDGYFKFTLESSKLPEGVALGKEGNALYVLAEASRDNILGSINIYRVSLPATVWLYDQDGNLICKEETSVSSLTYSPE